MTARVGSGVDVSSRIRSGLRHRAISGAAACVTAIVMLAAQGCTAHAGQPMRTPDDLLAWLSSHPTNVGISITAASGPVLQHNASQLFPLASTRKVLILGAYAVSVASGALDEASFVALSDIDRYYVAGSDGGSHEAAMRSLRISGSIHGDSVSLPTVAAIMIAYSDNAAADYLLTRLGGPMGATTAFATRMGMKRQQPMEVGLGTLMMWNLEPELWHRSTPAERSALSVEAAKKGRPASYHLPSPDVQRRLVEDEVAGTPGEWSAMVFHLFESSTLPERARSIMKQVMSRTGVAPDGKISTFAAKGGSFVGVITKAAYIKPTVGPALGVSLFMRGLPDALAASLERSTVLDAFLARLAYDPVFLAKAQARFVLG